jgi:hypothetical protein
LIVCGGRNAAFKAFQGALEQHAGAFNVLLVDSEGAVSAPPWVHLRSQGGWQAPGVPDDHCHLMVQMTEAWLVADPEALGSFFGRGFHRKALPRRNVEDVSGKELLQALERATRESAKGKYHKIRHGPELLRRISAEKVRSRAKHCDRLFQELEARLGR